ncbi:hypothetical protein [Marinisporobacter balticus]|uniref:Uncharacterized protein n=1 Tax=Marinisporobacter balticus TaxID=2018667 RepID=A0A4R2L5E9_9FIRM|nr:hypothetical protein [Marinisporobacter balticus]TCO79116.1 hypothetical protein EV214_103168 [Marinisporobacter balticus]
MENIKPLTEINSRLEAIVNKKPENITPQDLLEIDKLLDILVA